MLFSTFKEFLIRYFFYMPIMSWINNQLYQESNNGNILRTKSIYYTILQEYFVSYVAKKEELVIMKQYLLTFSFFVNCHFITPFGHITCTHRSHLKEKLNKKKKQNTRSSYQATPDYENFSFRSFRHYRHYRTHTSQSNFTNVSFPYF